MGFLLLGEELVLWAFGPFFLVSMTLSPVISPNVAHFYFHVGLISWRDVPENFIQWAIFGLDYSKPPPDVSQKRFVAFCAASASQSDFLQSPAFASQQQTEPLKIRRLLIQTSVGHLDQTATALESVVGVSITNRVTMDSPGTLKGEKPLRSYPQSR